MIEAVEFNLPGFRSATLMRRDDEYFVIDSSSPAPGHFVYHANEDGEVEDWTCIEIPSVEEFDERFDEFLKPLD